MLFYQEDNKILRLKIKNLVESAPAKQTVSEKEVQGHMELLKLLQEENYKKNVQNAEL